jgi:hypothetical protein
MTKYRVYGDKNHKYYTDVEAPTAESAWYISTQPNWVWHEVETDDTIEPFSVEEQN